MFILPPKLSVVSVVMKIKLIYFIKSVYLFVCDMSVLKWYTAVYVYI